jgi:hypothetical protein
VRRHRGEALEPRRLRAALLQLGLELVDARRQSSVLVLEKLSRRGWGVMEIGSPTPAARIRPGAILKRSAFSLIHAVVVLVGLPEPSRSVRRGGDLRSVGNPPDAYIYPIDH